MTYSVLKVPLNPNQPCLKIKFEYDFVKEVGLQFRENYWFWLILSVLLLQFV